MYIHESAIYRSHATDSHHSTYLGHPVVKAVSWVTKSTRWFSNDLDADTLHGLRNAIRRVEGLPGLPKR